MAFQDALIKLMSDGLPLWQFFALRSLLILPVLAIPVWRRGGMRAAVHPRTLTRSGLIVAMYVFFYGGMPVLDLPVISAVYYTGPVFIVILSSLLLRERVTPGQAGAVAVAFAGVVIVLRPGGETFSPAALIPLLSALCYALAAVATRGPLGRVDPWALTFSLNVVFVAAGGIGMTVTAAIGRPEAYPFLLSPWTALEAGVMSLLVFLAAISVAIHLLLARAYQLGPMPVVAGLDFSYLVFAVVWAALLFGTIPEGATVVGTVLVAAGGLWGILRRGH